MEYGAWAMRSTAARWWGVLTSEVTNSSALRNHRIVTQSVPLILKSHTLYDSSSLLPTKVLIWMKLIQRQLGRSARLLLSKQIPKQNRQILFVGSIGSRSTSNTAVRLREEDDLLSDMAKGSKFDLKVPKGTKDCMFIFITQVQRWAQILCLQKYTTQDLSYLYNCYWHASRAGNGYGH